MIYHSISASLRASKKGRVTFDTEIDEMLDEALYLAGK